MLDLLIRNGLVVTPSGEVQLDIAVADGRIVGLLHASVTEGIPATRIIDAASQIIVPGGIDPHVHTSWVIPTAAATGIRSANAGVVSRAAAHGGTTTLLDFAFCDPTKSIEQALREKASEYDGESYVDYSYHATFKSGSIPFSQLDEIHEVVEAGYPSFKVWMTNTTPSRPRQKTDFGDVWGLLQQTSRHGGIVAVHAEDDEIVMYQYRRLEREGRTGLENVHLAHNQLSEDLSFRRVIRLAELVGAPIYLMHVSAASGAIAVAEARARQLPVYGETLQHYLSFTHDDYQRPQGAIYHTYPSLKSEDDRKALWTAMERGVLSTVATDELCTPLDMKLRGKTIDDVTGGHVGVEVRMGLMFSEMVHKRGFPLARFVDTTSANAARIFGLYPQKGVIAVGSDADLVLIETFEPRPIDASKLHESDYSPWDGWEISAWPSATILRGSVIAEGDQLVGRPGDGKRVPRRVSPAVLTRPAC